MYICNRNHTLRRSSHPFSSHPESSNYAKYKTLKDVIAMFAPPKETVEVVRDWVVSSGIGRERIIHSDNRQWLAFDATIEEVELLLHTEYHEYEHLASGHIAPSCDSQVLLSTHSYAPDLQLATTSQSAFKSTLITSLQALIWSPIISGP